MGMESQPNLDPALPPSGLCNAVILAKPYSSFICASVLHSVFFHDCATVLCLMILPFMVGVLTGLPRSSLARQLPHLRRAILGTAQRHHSLGTSALSDTTYTPELSRLTASHRGPRAETRSSVPERDHRPQQVCVLLAHLVRSSSPREAGVSS